jgi:TonB family protein
MKVDTATGVVTDAYMAQSTGEPILDAEAIRAFRRWRFKPGTVSMVRTPIAFLMGGRGVRVSYEVKSQNMDDKLAAFLGKGTVLKGPIPQYPRSEQWTFKRGKGVYELHVNGEGRVSDVRVLTSSGDSSFDRAAVGTLGKWRLRRGPLILELPLSFTLTPTSFAVQLPKHEGAHRPRRR